MNVIDYFSDEQKRRSLLLLTLFHIFIITISNYLVRLLLKSQYHLRIVEFQRLGGLLLSHLSFLRQI